MIRVLKKINREMLKYYNGIYRTLNPNHWICIVWLKLPNHETNKWDQGIRIQINKIMIQIIKVEIVYRAPLN